MKRLAQVVLLLAGALALTAVAGASRGDPLVTVGSPLSPFSQNKQNEPAIAVNPNPVDLTGAMAAGANDNIDEEACNAGDDTTCPFTAGVGGSGIYFSFDGGSGWTQPTYTGWSARGCLGVVGDADPPCSPVVGPIGTLPNYFENGLVSDGDPEVAFGPQPGADGSFSWSNGTRLYYANLTSNFAAARSEQTIKGFEAIAVSRTDDIAGAAAGDNSAWMNPVIASKQNAALFSDHPTIAVDDASERARSSAASTSATRRFGARRSAAFPLRSCSTARTTAGNLAARCSSRLPSTTRRSGGRQDCQVDTDSKGNVYVVLGWRRQQDEAVLAVHRQVQQRREVAPRAAAGSRPSRRPASSTRTRATSHSTASQGRARNGAASSIANGAPTGIGATDELVVAWERANPIDTSPGPEREGGHHLVDGRRLDVERAGLGLACRRPAGLRGDRHLAERPSTSTSSTTTSCSRGRAPRRRRACSRESFEPRPSALTVRSGRSADLDREATGDARASSANAQDSEFLGDYNQIVSTNTFAAAVWNDARRADCPAEDAYRQALTTNTPQPRPRRSRTARRRSVTPTSSGASSHADEAMRRMTRGAP